MKRDRILTQLPVGYTGGDPASVAQEAATFLTGFTRMTTEHPLTGLERTIEELAPQAADHAWSNDEE